MMIETSPPEIRRDYTSAIGVSHLSPSTDVVFRAKQGTSLSPIGSPLPEGSSPPRYNLPIKHSQPSQRFNIKPYNLFCSDSPEIANFINVVSPQKPSANHPKSWGGESVAHNAPSTPLVSSAPKNGPNFPFMSNSSISGHTHPSTPVTSLVFKLGGLNLEEWTPSSHPSPASNSQFISREPEERDALTDPAWMEEWLSGMGGMEMEAEGRSNSDLANVGLIQDIPVTGSGFGVPRSVWELGPEDDLGYVHYPYPANRSANGTRSDDTSQDFLLPTTRGRRLSYDTRSRSSSSDSDVSPHVIEDEKIPASPHAYTHARLASLSPSSSPPEYPSPTVPTRKTSRPFSPQSPAAAFLSRSRVSTHPVTRGYNPRQQLRGYGPRQPHYPYDVTDLPHSDGVASVTHVSSPMSYPRTYAHSFVNSESAGIIDGKSRSRSAGEGSREKSIPSSPNHHYRYRHKAKTARHRHRSVNRKDEDLARFELVIKKVISGQDVRTTLMIKNIPNKYDQEMLLEAINKNFKGSYDFFYLPIDFKNKCNVGYAFINFINYETVAPFHEEFNQKKWEKFNSEKVCKITYARIQGKMAFIDHFRNSSLMYEDQACRPLIFHSNGLNMGELEPFPPANVSRARPVGLEELVDEFSQ